jgi:hypothetical protein
MSDVKLLAFYLPQYHPIHENNVAWGRGFTEWTNVAKARPLFPAHYQPHVPADLGFYDLRVPEVREQQVALARAYGIHGFCFYYYWFNGRRLLDRPLDEFRASGLDFPFCVCWANENWSRRWDGSEHEIIVEQEHSPEADEKFIHDVLPILKDPRYIRIDGAPLLLVYRISLLPDPAATAARWRSTCARAGLERIHLSAVQSFGFGDPRPVGFDSAVEFPPHGFTAEDINEKVEGLPEDFEGHLYDYREVAQFHLHRSRPPHSWFRGVMAGWDNTPRRGTRGHVYLHGSPREYELWLRGVIEETRRSVPEGQRFVFINAWNEWGEGAHLEPDLENGHAYLDATQRALRNRMPWRDVLGVLRNRNGLSSDELRSYLEDLEFALSGLQRSVDYFARQKLLRETLGRDVHSLRFAEVHPERLHQVPQVNGGHCFIDRIDSFQLRPDLSIGRSHSVYFGGWSFVPGVPANREHTRRYLTLFSLEHGRSYYAMLDSWDKRKDVARAFPDVPESCTEDCGFQCFASLRDLPPGRYRIGVTHIGENVAGQSFLGHSIILV